jgi:hypothetical protein
VDTVSNGFLEMLKDWWSRRFERQAQQTGTYDVRARAITQIGELVGAQTLDDYEIVVSRTYRYGGA